MRKLWDNTRDEENSEEETRTIDGNLDCEEQIIEDIERFGRVRTGLMKNLRKDFGRDIAKEYWKFLISTSITIIFGIIALVRIT